MSLPKPPLTHTPRPKWMLAMSLGLIDGILEHPRRADHNWNVTRTLTKSVRKSLTVDTRRRAEVASEYIEICLETPKGTSADFQGACSILKLWYQHTSGKQPHPSHTYLDNVSGYYKVLYHREDPPPPWTAHTNSRHPVRCR